MTWFRRAKAGSSDESKPALRGPLRQFIPARNFHIGSSVPPRAALRIVKEFERLPSRVATFGTAVSVQDGVSKCPPLKRRILVDVRGPEEAQKDGELPYTNRIECGPEDDVEAAITRGVEAVILVNDPEREIVVYCKSGKRAGRFAQALMEKGYNDVKFKSYAELKNRYDHAHESGNHDHHSLD
eukprot:CAMPEP_0170169362 /NCGR_PEP_ID=MMETSP0040_2-20121228/2283_1 /TAXON_ID=641309 /ORGANISM="Lotharella oceanica, Strain CCMP622" /LENGTH=183 /DNA_ID=CAMNT_0010408065 /DNA_START=218 /DNA_END=770 /DNA_ORIENTATION=-